MIHKRTYEEGGDGGGGGGGEKAFITCHTVTVIKQHAMLAIPKGRESEGKSFWGERGNLKNTSERHFPLSRSFTMKSEVNYS